MNFFIKIRDAIHGLPEDARKFFAGLCMLVAGIAFLGLWTSFVSSRLVALAPGPIAPARTAQDTAGVSEIVQTAPAPETETLSPVAGIADILRGFQDAVSGTAAPVGSRSAEQPSLPQGFFASVGQGLAAVAEAIYVKLAPWVPPY